MNQDATILIAGAGLGGLTAAACLLQRGFRVRVYEQSQSLREVGAGVQCSANAVRVLDALGLRPALDRVAVRPQAFEYRRFDTRELMYRIPLGAQHEAAHGAPYFHIHRADLHGLLVEKVRSLDPEAITLDARVEGFEALPDGVALVLAHGRRVEGGVLVGADGIKSAIRAQILGATPVTYTGDVAWRAVIPVERLPAGIMETVSTVWCGPKKHAVMFYIRAGTLMNFVGLVESDQPEGESWVQKRPWEDLKADYAGWNDTIQTVIDAIDRDGCYRYALNNRPPVGGWSTARATLLGDSAHPTLPYIASGANMAIEDGAILARCLQERGCVAAALRTYERARVERTSRVVIESNQSRGLYRIEDEAAMREAFRQKDLTRSRADWLYSYDPWTVPLPAD